MNPDPALQTFIAEARELLEEMESALLNAEHGIGSGESVHAIFRAAHTIKGSAGLFCLDHIVSFTHAVESVLDEVRAGRIAIRAPLVALLLACCDHIGVMIDALAAGRLDEDLDTTAAGAPLVEQLRACLGHAAPPAAVSDPGAAGAVGRWHISLRFGPEVLRNGMDPVAFLRYLTRLGKIVAIVTLFERLPPPPRMDPETCYLDFEIAFDSCAGRADIEAVFDFVAADCVLHILPPHSPASAYAGLLRAAPDSAARVGAMLVRCGSVDACELDAALAGRPRESPAAPCAAPARGRPVETAAPRERRAIRVDADKLDHLINLVGELIIAGARSDVIARRVRDSELSEASDILKGLVEAVRDSAQQLRMVKIGATFERFQRVVHDVAREIGKDIGLIVSGEDTELDKTVVERIGDPLTHLVRNAIDHGIEAAPLRLAAGKSAKGSVRLNAYHDSGAIVIEVADDGAGLNRDKILSKALERGLVDPERRLSDGEIYGLIFEPGFSTADQVSKLSGRGVGMDVVKRNVAALRGSVAVDSVAGAGTTVTVRLPLTLATINGFMVSLGKAVFVIPLELIEQCVEFAGVPGRDYADLHGQALPFLRLRDLFGSAAPPPPRENLVIVKHGGMRAGLVVDALLGEFQTVIKPLGAVFAGAKCISGSTILGSGEVGLILDVAALFEWSGAREAALA